MTRAPTGRRYLSPRGSIRRVPIGSSVSLPARWFRPVGTRRVRTFDLYVGKPASTDRRQRTFRWPAKRAGRTLMAVIADIDVSPVAALLGDRARARIVQALLGGRALPAGELARHAGVGAPTASAHLAKLVDGGLLTVTRSGRHRYFEIANADVSRAVEALAAIAPPSCRTRFDRRRPDRRWQRAVPATTTSPARLASRSQTRCSNEGRSHRQPKASRSGRGRKRSSRYSRSTPTPFLNAARQPSAASTGASGARTSGAQSEPQSAPERSRRVCSRDCPTRER